MAKLGRIGSRHTPLLDLQEVMPNLHRKVPGNYAAPRLVHKLVLSMPPGTPADGVLGAVRDFARE